MAQTTTYRVPMSAIAAQLAIIAGHSVVPGNIASYSYNVAAGTITIRLYPIPTPFTNVYEFFTFTKVQVANFYQTYSGNTINGANITNIAQDANDMSYLEIFL